MSCLNACMSEKVSNVAGGSPSFSGYVVVGPGRSAFSLKLWHTILAT